MSGDLLQDDAYYVHPALRETIPMPIVYYSDELGRVVHRIDPEGEFGLIEKFTLQDLCKYYEEKLWRYYHRGLEPPEIARTRGGLQWLLKYYSLDEILFTIDAALEIRAFQEKPKPVSVTEIQDYIEEGRARLAKVQRLLAESGLSPARRAVPVD